MTTAALKVLIPVDFSEPSRLAMAWAFDYAQRATCELHLLHVVENDADSAEFEREFQEISAAAEVELRGMAPEAGDRARVGKLHRHTATGDPAHEIMVIARRLEAELIVMGTHGRSGVRRAIAGSVAEETVRRAPCTVVCVKARQAG